MDEESRVNDSDNKEAKVEEGFNNKSCKPWKERSTVEKSLAVLTLFLALIFFVLLAVLLRPRNIFYGVYSDKKTCATETCVREAFRLLNNVDPSLDACHDFSELVCKKTSGRLPDADEDLLSSVRELLEANEGDEIGSVRKSKRFYRSCVTTELKDQSTGNIVRELLRKAKMTEDSTSNQNVYNREKTLALLTIYGDKNPFFKFRRTPQIIYLYPGHPVLRSDVLLDETTEHAILRMKYKKLIFSALIKMDIPEESASSDAEEMVNFERIFATLAATAKCTGNSSEVSLREMEDMFPELKWSVIIRYIYEYYGLENDFSQKLTILLTCEDYFRKIIHLMSDYDFRTLEKFIMWSFTLHYLPVLDPTFRPFYEEIKQVVETHWRGNVLDHDWEICTYATMHYFNSPVAHLYHKYKHSKQTVEEIEDLFNDIQLAYEEVVCNKEWLDKETAAKCKTTISETELIIGLPSNIRDSRVIERMYSLVNVTDDIMENLLALDKAIFAENVIGTEMTPMHSTPMDAGIYYDRGALTILYGATLPPVFHVGAPRYFNYGWMGFIVAREMWNAVRPLVFSEKELSPDEAKEVHMMEGCLIEQYSVCQRSQKERLEVTNEGKLAVMADQTALLVATEAYLEYEKKNGDELSAPGLNISNGKLFFLNFGQLMCGASIGNPLENNEPDLKSFNACRLNSIIGNSANFLKTFGCSSGLAVSNSSECAIWVS